MCFARRAQAQQKTKYIIRMDELLTIAQVATILTACCAVIGLVGGCIHIRYKQTKERQIDIFGKHFLVKQISSRRGTAEDKELIGESPEPADVIGDMYRYPETFWFTKKSSGKGREVRLCLHHTDFKRRGVIKRVRALVRAVFVVVVMFCFIVL